MSRLILLLAVIAAVYLYYRLRLAQALPAPQRKAAYIKLALAVAALLLAVLAATGHMNWLGAVFAALLVALRQSLPLLIRIAPLLASRFSNRAAAAGHTSTVATGLLRMQLQHDTGALHGEVLRGPFQGRNLDDLDRQQLEEFRRYCQREDHDSLRLLDSYLEQRFPGAGFGDGENTHAPASGPTMGRAEALAVLGLAEGATREQIIAAHRQLIQKLHPDRGGNDYLAAQVNRARDVLL